jgi:hypothetical protein
LNEISQYSKENELLTIRSNIEDACARGKLNELLYELLKEKMTNYEK